MEMDTNLPFFKWKRIAEILMFSACTTIIQTEYKNHILKNSISRCCSGSRQMIRSKTFYFIRSLSTPSSNKKNKTKTNRRRMQSHKIVFTQPIDNERCKRPSKLIYPDRWVFCPNREFFFLKIAFIHVTQI